MEQLAPARGRADDNDRMSARPDDHRGGRDAVHAPPGRRSAHAARCSPTRRAARSTTRDSRRAAIDGLGVASFTLAPDHAIDLAVALGLRVSWLMDAATGGAAGIDMLQHARARRGRRRRRERAARGRRRLPRRVVRAARRRATTSPRASTSRRSRSAGRTRSSRCSRSATCGRTGSSAPTTGASSSRSAPGRPAIRAPSTATPLSADEYLAAPLVADPLGLLDCVPVVAGADALIVSGARRRRAACARCAPPTTPTGTTATGSRPACAASRRGSGTRPAPAPARSTSSRCTTTTRRWR